MKTGDTHTITFYVSDNETAMFLGSGGLNVYATPAMICHMEKTAFTLAYAEGYQTVGTKVDISHLRACKAGTEIKVTAELVEIDGRRLEFIVRAEDANGIIGEGKHQRFIIDPERFMAKLG